MSECNYQVSTSMSQKVILGFMGTSLVINFGIMIWWLRLYCYKRKVRKQQEQAEFDEYPDGSETGDLEKDRGSIDKEVESVYLPYRRPTFQPKTERDSVPAKVRLPALRKEDHQPTDPPARLGLETTREAMNDRDSDDQPAADVKSQRSRAAGAMVEGKADRCTMRGPRG